MPPLRALLTGLATAAVIVAADAAPLIAQPTAASHIEEGDRESAARRPGSAYIQYEAAVALSPANYDALWRASREAVDLAEYEKDASRRSRLNEQAVGYARRAITANPNDAAGYFSLSRALGRTALTVGVRDRVKYAADIRDNALKALALDPDNAGAMHVLGVWNGEVMRLNGFSRVFAKAFLGAQVFSAASWPNATRFMQMAVKEEPLRLVHHLDLARVYRDTGRRADARAEYEAALRCAPIDANDDHYRREAQSELRALSSA